MSQSSGPRGSKSVAILFLLVAMVLSLTTAGSAMAGGAVHQPAQTQSGRPLGVLPTRGSVNGIVPFLGSGKLTYHGGLTMHTNKVYAIYWVPSGFTVSANYVSLINQFFADVAAASGQTSNVYFSDTQYTDSVNGHILYSSTFGGSVMDTHALPASGCSDSPATVCVTDAQLQTEVQRVVAAQGWTANSSTEFFMFTAKGIGSCFDSSSSQCAFSTYCAYHNWIGSGTSATLYANMPYADTVATNCDSGQHPNNDDADATLNVTSHEHNETITDEQGNAWFDRAGFENGDKCAWIFGTGSGSTGHMHNETINGHVYWLQEEWSNSTNRCVQTGL